MPRKPAQKQPRKPSPPPAVDAAQLKQMVRAHDRRIAAAPTPYDEADSPRDRMFAIIMQRIDGLQAERAHYEKIILAVLARPVLLAALLQALHSSFAAALRRAKLPQKPWHVLSLGLAYIATISAWRNDTTADLAKTMRACDRALAFVASDNAL